jgi:hypothetical protein
MQRDTDATRGGEEVREIDRMLRNSDGGENHRNVDGSGNANDGDATG